MKRVLLFLLLLLPVCGAMAQTYKFNTTSFAYKVYVNDQWSDWSDWESSHMLVVMNLERKVINIYSENRQDYDIYEYLGEETDNSGGKSLRLNCVNEDGLRCQIRLRIQSDGSKQLYVDFNDMMWVYGLEDR